MISGSVFCSTDDATLFRLILHVMAAIITEPTPCTLCSVHGRTAGCPTVYLVATVLSRGARDNRGESILQESFEIFVGIG